MAPSKYTKLSFLGLTKCSQGCLLLPFNRRVARQMPNNQYHNKRLSTSSTNVILVPNTSKYQLFNIIEIFFQHFSTMLIHVSFVCQPRCPPNTKCLHPFPHLWLHEGHVSPVSSQRVHPSCDGFALTNNKSGGRNHGKRDPVKDGHFVSEHNLWIGGYTYIYILVVNVFGSMFDFFLMGRIGSPICSLQQSIFNVNIPQICTFCTPGTMQLDMFSWTHGILTKRAFPNSLHVFHVHETLTIWKDPFHSGPEPKLPKIYVQ